MSAAYFDGVADLYAAARPTYPAALFDAMFDGTDLTPGLRVLEIGPGTGQASRDLVGRGVDLTCYELGPTLAARTAAAVPTATVVNAPASAATGTFEVVCGFTSLHWLGEDLWPLAHRLLEPGGRLAHIGTIQYTAEPDWFGPLEPVFRRAFDGFQLPPRLSELSPLPWDEALFDRVAFEVFPRSARYDGAAFARLHATYSPVGILPESDREPFLADLAAAVDAQGGIIHTTANVLNVFTRR
jgi:SAM-dependent methyltransferase